MMLNVDSIKLFLSKLNTKGIPLPLVRDPDKGSGSVSLTLVFLASVWVQVGLLGKFSKLFGDVNMDQAMQFFYATIALYWGRKVTTRTGSLDSKEDVNQ